MADHSLAAKAPPLRRRQQTRRKTESPPSAANIRYCIEFEKSSLVSNFRNRGFEEELDIDADWDIIWSTVPTAASIFSASRSGNQRLQRHQVINHFPTHYELTRKDLLAKNWKRYVRNATKYNRVVPDILPTTFYIPSDYGMWYSAACKHRDWIWIVKPVGKAQGRGIFLVDAASAGKLKALTRTRPTTPGDRGDSGRGGGGSAGAASPYKSGSAAATFSSGSSKLDSMYIVSRYIDNPLLVGRRKFDLRLYVLVTSWQPLQAYIHRSGFARFCAVQYTATPKDGSGKRAAAADLDNLYMHLTNVAIQKHGDEYSVTHGGKWPLESLRAHLKCTVGEAATARAFADIRSLIHHSLLAVQPSMVSAPGCFELYGYDVMLDSSLAPWLIEVNASPSLSATTAHDKRRKTTLVADVLDVVMPHTRPMVPSAPAAGARSGAGSGEHWRPAAMPQFELLADELADKASHAAAAIRSSGGKG